VKKMKVETRGGGVYDVLSSSRSVLRERRSCDRLSAENIAGWKIAF
jgi:hypothetical protein